MLVVKMDTAMVQHETKLKKLLNKFLEPGYRLGNDVYLNILLSHLSGADKPAQAEQLQQLPIFSEWLEEAVSLWERTGATPSSSIATFALNLASLVSVADAKFRSLNSTDLYTRLFKVLHVRSKSTNCSVKLGYLKILQSFMKHKPGLDFLCASDYWRDILGYCLENQTIYLTRDGYNFIFDLLSNLVDSNPAFCEMVVKEMVAELQEERFLRNGLVQKEVDIVQMQKELMPSLKLVTFVLEKCYLSDSASECQKIPDLFLKVFNVEVALWGLLGIASDPELVFNISKPLFIACYLSIEIGEELARKETLIPMMTDFGNKFFKLFNVLIGKESAVSIVRLCHLGHVYWKKVAAVLPACSSSTPLLFENQLIIFQIMPILAIAFTDRKHRERHTDELTDMFINKLFKISCQDTIRYAYAYRTLVRKLSKSKSFDIGQKAIYYLMKTKEQLHRDRAVIVFQALVYAMKSLSKAVTDKSQLAADLLAYQNGFLAAMFDGLSLLIKEFKITWRESVETICLTSLTMDFLNCPTLPYKLAVQGMQLMHLTIANFMPPNLALLVDEVSDSSIVSITPMLFNRLHDRNWEIRDCALEILQTVVDIAHLKFPAFQQMIIDERLCQLVATLSTDDSDAYVRVSAIKCLTMMIKVPAFWTNCLENEHLTEKMLSILQDETEGHVRCEAVKLLCEIYEHQYVAVGALHTLYAAMAAAVFSDLYWEVRISALDFWDKAISHEMANQGMIDGVFPSVTFSKQDKKIVSLTEPEIQNRLNKVLSQLSEYGCLAALLGAMKDDFDLEVSRKALRITSNLRDLLKKYSLLAATEPSPEVSCGVWDTFHSGKASPARAAPPPAADSVIDSIVSCPDVNLLASVYKAEASAPTPAPALAPALQTNVQAVSPDDFKKFLSKDLNSLVDERDKWLNKIDDLGSILDDILRSYEDTNHVNDMDCY